MSTVSLLKNIPTQKLLDMIPPPLRALIDVGLIKQATINVALFSADRKYVTTSGEVKKIVDSIDELKPLLVIGWSFTVEAAQKMRKTADYFICQEDEFWTDESYHQARQNRF